VEQYQKAAEQGDAQAQNNLGVYYYSGKGVTKDYKEAVKWYQKAAEQGLANAQINLGVCYFCGHGVTQDYTKAVKWFRKAAEQGLAVAQNNLGWCYEHGEGVTQDYVKAKEWYRKAADQGNAKAKNNLDRLRLLDKKDQDEITKPKQNAKPLRLLDVEKLPEIPAKIVMMNLDEPNKFFLWDTLKQRFDFWFGNLKPLLEEPYVQSIMMGRLAGPNTFARNIELSFGYGWDWIVETVKYLECADFDGEFQYIQVGDENLTDKYHANGNRLDALEELKWECASLTIAGDSETLVKFGMMITFYNQTNVIEILSPRTLPFLEEDERDKGKDILFIRYVETMIRRIFGTYEEMKFAASYKIKK